MKKKSTIKTRREFLKVSALGGALSWTVPGFVMSTMDTLISSAMADDGQLKLGKDHPILVVLQLTGGNDGLNTIIPHSNDYYHKARPNISISKKTSLLIDDEFAMHRSLKGLKSLYDNGNLAIVNGIGYPNPNRSHFRSMEIWHTATDSNKTSSDGWIGKYFDNECGGEDPTVGISIGNERPQAFAGKNPKGVSFKNPERYRYGGKKKSGLAASEDEFFRDLNAQAEMFTETISSGGSIGSLSGYGAGTPGEDPLKYLERVSLDAELSSDRINQIVGRKRTGVTYPKTRLASDLHTIADLIAGDMPTRIYYVSQGGYDTHTQQKGAHERLLGEFGDAVKSFHDDLVGMGVSDRVTVLTFSEFGRRVAENASGGTDHGQAAPLFVMGENVSPGFHGAMLSLAPKDLVKGDITYTTDFRGVYASVLENVLGVFSRKTLGRNYRKMKIFKKSG